MKKINRHTVKQWIKNNLQWIIIFGLIIVLLVFSSFFWESIDFWSGAIGNLFATIIGVILGVPVVLWLERKRQLLEDKENQLVKESETKKVLSLIREELIIVQHGHSCRRSNPTSLQLHPLKTSLWRALSNSGEIQALRDPYLLNRISSTYYLIDIVNELEAECYKAIRGINVTLPSGNLASVQLLSEARSFDEELEQSLSDSLKSINTIIGK